MKVNKYEEYIEYLHDIIDYLECELHNRIIEGYQERAKIPQTKMKKDIRQTYKRAKYDDSRK